MPTKKERRRAETALLNSLRIARAENPGATREEIHAIAELKITRYYEYRAEMKAFFKEMKRKRAQAKKKPTPASSAAIARAAALLEDAERMASEPASDAQAAELIRTIKLARATLQPKAQQKTETGDDVETED